MKKSFDYLAATTLVIPASFIVWVSMAGLWSFIIGSGRSRTIYFEAGGLIVREPWSHFFGLLSASAVLLSATAIVRFHRRKLLAWFFGFTVLIAVSLTSGVSALMAKVETPDSEQAFCCAAARSGTRVEQAGND